MPRVNLGRDPTKERQEATRWIIRRGMVEQGIARQVDIAKTRHEPAVVLGEATDVIVEPGGDGQALQDAPLE